MCISDLSLSLCLCLSLHRLYCSDDTKAQLTSYVVQGTTCYLRSCLVSVSRILYCSVRRVWRLRPDGAWYRLSGRLSSAGEQSERDPRSIWERSMHYIYHSSPTRIHNSRRGSRNCTSSTGVRASRDVFTCQMTHFRQNANLVVSTCSHSTLLCLHCRGHHPAECDKRFLNIACKLDRYGMDFHLITVSQSVSQSVRMGLINLVALEMEFCVCVCDVRVSFVTISLSLLGCVQC